jgi:voltage-gated potassium channel
MTLRRRLSRWFDDDASHNNRAARRFNLFLAALILVNVGAVILETVDPIRQRYDTTFELIEHVATAFFTVEYVLRLWTVVELHDPRFVHPVWGRLRYLRSFFALVDLVAVLPALLGFLGAADLRVLRLLRLLRMLKLTRHSTVFNLLWAVFREEARSIAALVFILSLTLTISGALAYMIESEEQPAVFSSIPAAMWWAIETLTTVGYGDMVPATAMGKILGGLVSVVGIGTLALFSGVITVGFLDQLRIRREQISPVAQMAAAGPPARAMQAGDGFKLTDLEMTGPFIEPQAPAGSGVCPHCGHLVHLHEHHAAPRNRA